MNFKGHIAIFADLCYNQCMQIGISTGSLFPQYNAEDAINKIKEAGADTAEVFLSTFYEYRPEFAKSVSKGMRCAVNSVHANSVNFEGNLFHASRRVRGDGFYWLDQVCRSAQLLGCKNYTFHGFNRIREGGDDFDLLASRLAEASSFAAGYGVTLCLENVCWALYDRPGVFGQLRRRIPALSGVFDIKQARRSHYPYQAYLKDMSGAIAYAHLSDISSDGRTCLPGEGITNFSDMFKNLKDEGFCGPLIIEVYGGDYNGEEELKRSVSYIRELAEQIF